MIVEQAVPPFMSRIKHHHINTWHEFSNGTDAGRAARRIHDKDQRYDQGYDIVLSTGGLQQHLQRTFKVSITENTISSESHTERHRITSETSTERRAREYIKRASLPLIRASANIRQYLILVVIETFKVSFLAIAFICLLSFS